MAAGTTNSLRALSDDADYYLKAFEFYQGRNKRVQSICEWVDGHLSALVASPGVNLLPEDSLTVLSVGAGDGIIDHRILGQLRASGHPKLHAVILDPDSHMVQQYKDLVSKESTRLQGVDFDWRQQTFQEYQTTTKEEEKFHFISCINSLYYCGDLEQAVKFLYDKLHRGGILFITIISNEGGLGKLWEHLSKMSVKERQFTSYYVQEVCKNLDVPIAEMARINIQSDISPCFDAPPPQLSQDGNLLLDFLTHTVNFAQEAPAKLREDVLRLLRSPENSITGADGKIMLDASNCAIIIRKQ